MTKCIRTTELEVYHTARDGGNGLDRYRVLCQQCHEATPTSYGEHGESLVPYDNESKEFIFAFAGNQCQCTSNRGCH